MSVDLQNVVITMHFLCVFLGFGALNLKMRIKSIYLFGIGYMGTACSAHVLIGFPIFQLWADFLETSRMT